jgi:hypothetical protein
MPETSQLVAVLDVEEEQTSVVTFDVVVSSALTV